MNFCIKRLWKSLLALCLALLMLFPTSAYAWNTDDLTSTTWPHLIGWTGGREADYGSFFSLRDSGGKLYAREALTFGVNPLVCVAIPEGGSAVFSPATFYSDYEGKTAITGTTFTCSQSLPADHSSPVMYTATASDGREYPFFIIALPARNSVKNTDAEVDEIIDYLVKPLTNILKEYNAKLEAMYQSRVSGSLSVGDYQPAQFNMLYQTVRSISQVTATSAENYPDGGMILSEYHDWSSADAEEVMRQVLEYDAYKSTTGSKLRRYSKAYYQALLEVAAPYYLDFVEENRIAEPVIDSYAVGDSVGLIDKENRTVTIRFPEETDFSTLPSPTIEMSSWLKRSQVAGSLESGKVTYNLIPWEKTTGVIYDGKSEISEYGLDLGADLSEYWDVLVETDDPYTIASSFSVTTADGVTRYGKINEENGTITLNLPTGTDLTAVTPKVVHTGTSSSMDSGAFDFSDGKTQTLTVYNSTYNLERSYTVTITAEESAENAIVSYRIGKAQGTIDAEKAVVEITIPYATDLSSAEPEVEYSEFYKSVVTPDTLKEGDNTYVVTAENGAERTWTVKITRTPAATGNRIVSFRYGSAQGSVNNITGEITMELPTGTSPSFSPVIEVSPFATISPASGVKQDFSKDVTYVVTSESGDTNTYVVKVSFTGAVAENTYKASLQSVVEKIIMRYRTSASDDWEYMNVGFYDKTLDNMDATTIAEIVAGLDSTTNVAMTNLDRKIMTLTARGIDCSNLAKYNNGEPFIDSKGNKIDDLVEVLYNYTGGYTINGPIFALLALDMGNYTIPGDAVWTREALLEKILNHVYLSDGFDTDMVAMLMQSIAPYQDDPVYGERVKAKLDEGVDIIIAKMNADYGFKAWGAVNSETAAQVICALSAMGIDCHADPRFSDGQGHSAIQHWVDNFVNSSGYFHHTKDVTNNAMATYQGCYASQWYLNFLNNGGAGHPYSLYYQRFDFSRKLSTDASITSFTLEGKKGEIDEENGTITVTLPTGTPLKNMHPQLTLAEGATLYSPDISSGVTFAEGIATTFIVQAEDGTTKKSYAVTVNLSDDVEASGAELYTDTIKLKNANILYDLDILEKSVTTADGYTDIELAVNAGVDTKNLLLSADISYGATCTPAVDGETTVDLTDWTTFVVKSADGKNENTYRIKVTPRTQASIASFSLTIGGTVYDGVIDNTLNTITVSGVDDSNLTTTRFAPSITLGPDTLVCSPAAGLEQNFAQTVEYTVTGKDTEKVLSRIYKVYVLNKSGSAITANGSGGSSGDNTPVATTAKITGFSVLGVDGVIDNTAGTITVTLPAGANVSAVAPTVTVPTGAVVSPVSGQVVNLTSPLTYTVTLGSESRSYTVSVKYERSISQQLWDEVAENSDVADHQTSYGHKFS